MRSVLRAFTSCLAMAFVMAMAARCLAAPTEQTKEERKAAQEKIAGYLPKNPGQWIELTGTSKTWRVSEQGVADQSSEIAFISSFQVFTPNGKALVHLTPYTLMSNGTSVAFTKDILCDGKLWLVKEYSEFNTGMLLENKLAYISKDSPGELVALGTGCCGTIYDWTRNVMLRDRFYSKQDFGTYAVANLPTGETLMEYTDTTTSLTVRGTDIKGEFVPKEVICKYNTHRAPDEQGEDRVTYTTDPDTGRLTMPLTILRTSSRGKTISNRSEAIITKAVSIQDITGQIEALYLIPRGWTIRGERNEESLRLQTDYDLHQSGSPFALNPNP